MPPPKGAVNLGCASVQPAPIFWALRHKASFEARSSREKERMKLRKLGTTDLEIAPLVLGGNVFGWTADRETSFAIMDAFLEAGFNAIDTADVYMRYAPGLKGGESETIIGEWMKDRGVRQRIVLITKGGLEMSTGEKGLGRAYLPKACEASLQRLQTDYIDVYLAHVPDPSVPIEETLEANQKLIDTGKIRYAGCSNYSPEQLQNALAAAENGRARYAVVEPPYNLIDREKYEGALEDICAGQRLGVITYYALAAGFLTGKYRRAEDLSNRSRGTTVAGYLNPRGLKLLAALDSVAGSHNATPAQIALAWLMARRSVTAPIASVTNLKQLSDILASTALKLDPQDLGTLDLGV
jgi:aryl-alcohol dehydrogenase-like predicted oxidoreductase